MSLKSWLFTSIGLCLIGCSVGPDYHPPDMDIPQEWKGEPTKSDPSVYCDYWWEAFDDEELNALEKQALDNNYDLLSAFNRIQEAKAIMEGTKAELYPHLHLNPLYDNRGVMYESYTTGKLTRAHKLLYEFPLDLSYEIDLWGKIRNRYRSTQHQWEAQIESYHAIYLSLTAELAMVYFQLRTFDKQLLLLQTTLKSREKALEINQSKYRFKWVDFVDVAEAAEEVSNTLIQYEQISRERQLLENRLAVLLGTPASTFCFNFAPLQDLPPEIPSGLPSDVLKRRPDIAEAERMMAAEHALIKSRYASFFPSLELTGALGFLSLHFKYFMKNFSRLWNYGVESSQMIFDAGQLEANLSAQKARFAEACNQYKQKVLICFEEVENALSNLESYKNEHQEIAKSVQWSQKTLQIENSKYRKGLISYLDVVIRERDYLQREMTMNELRGKQFIATVHLIKAIGGGWNTEN